MEKYNDDQSIAERSEEIGDLSDQNTVNETTYYLQRNHRCFNPTKKLGAIIKLSKIDKTNKKQPSNELTNPNQGDIQSFF